MADVFISYRQSERPAVEEIAKRLRTLGFSVWFDASLAAGESFSDEIDREARNSMAVLVCWSPAARDSRWVKAESMIGFEQDKLAACYLAGPDGFSPPTPFNTVHSEDLRTWLLAPDETDAGWRSILRRLGRLCERRDIEDWAGLDGESQATELRAWISRHSASPLFMSVERLLQAREQEEAERLRIEGAARERRLSEEAERHRLESEREELEAATARKAREEQQAIAEAEARQRAVEGARTGKQNRRVALLLCVGLGLGGGWYYLQASERAAACKVEREAAQLRHGEYQLERLTESRLAHSAREFRVGGGETMADVLLRAGASREEANAVLSSLAGVYDTRRLRPGQPITLYFSETQLAGIAFRSEPGASVTAQRTTAGGFAAREVAMPLTFEIARVAGPVESNLYATALAKGATDREIGALADAFAYDIDFQRDVQPGDNFELVFERYYDDEGNTVRTGDLLFVSLESRRGSRAFYSFMAPGDTRPDWYDTGGRSARRFLMRTPINGAQVSAGFTPTHPGIDFTAPVGTPILAAGEGTIERAEPFNSFGNYVRIRHANGYETSYAHMSRFARGVRAGSRVRQGQIIGYVGATGRTDAPHLYYEVIRRGQQVDPANLVIATGRNLAGRALELFEIERQRIDTLRAGRANEASTESAPPRPRAREPDC